MKKTIDKFQRLLLDIFHFDCADLNFGIYRVMNHKRDVIEKFISTDQTNRDIEMLHFFMAILAIS